ncbi:unnamed protein product [Pocillopora meandrina]|uniref:Uncharacterized protein n=1 Tax=Pocillopora meandrina TaxID=46732 RepID=A0AAU9XEB3_9CNID|nr:unnamed protein product [Pocillopora meandrina]
MDKHKEIEEDNSQEFKLFRSRPVTAGGIENGIRFFTAAVNALDRIEGLLFEIGQTKLLVRQMIGEFSLAGGKIRLNPGEQANYVCLEKNDIQDKEAKSLPLSFSVPISLRLPSMFIHSRCQKRLKQKHNKTLLEICEELKNK